VSPVRYELVFSIPEDAVLHSDRRELLRSVMEVLVVSVVTHSRPAIASVCR
jgi:hypothetical protein